MKTISIRSNLLALTLGILLTITGNAVAENSTSSQNTLKPSSVSVEASHPMAVAHQQIDQAREYYKKGELDKVKSSLDAASKWLKNHQDGNEAAELVSEIRQLQEKIENPSKENEGAISRLWHRSSALVAREIEQISKSWTDSPIASATMKHLIDARTRFSYAEHDLFSIHDDEKARYEINKTLAYLDKANEIAIPRVREKIISLKKDIQQLPTSQTNAAEVRTIIQSLEMAKTSVNKATHSVSPEIQARSKKIAEDINNLQKDIFLLEKRQQYDSVMKRLRELDKLL